MSYGVFISSPKVSEGLMPVDNSNKSIQTCPKSHMLYIYLLFLFIIILSSSQFKSFAYLYNEDQFIFSLAKDVKVIRTLPKYLKGARRKKEIPSFKVPYSASPFYYLHHVLPVLKKHSVVELVVSNGGCLQVKTTYGSCSRSIIFIFIFPTIIQILSLLARHHAYF